MLERMPRSLGDRCCRRAPPRHRACRRCRPRLRFVSCSYIWQPSRFFFFLAKGKSGSKSSLLGESLEGGGSTPAKGHSPEISKKKSILKKGDSIHREETERLIPEPSAKETVDEGPRESFVSPVVAAAVVAATGTAATAPALAAAAAVAAGKPPLKAIGPKTGPKPHAQPIKFVGIEDDKEPSAPASGRPGGQIFCSRAPRLLSPPPAGSTLGRNGVTNGNLDDAGGGNNLRCSNPSCAFNRVAQVLANSAICLCGQAMEAEASQSNNNGCPQQQRNATASPPDVVTNLNELNSMMSVADRTADAADRTLYSTEAVESGGETAGEDTRLRRPIPQKFISRQPARDSTALS